jgi:hypothetical protein
VKNDVVASSKTTTESAQKKGRKTMQTMKNDFSSNQGGAKKAGGRGRQKGSPVTEERAKAQRAKLDTQAEARQV